MNPHFDLDLSHGEVGEGLLRELLGGKRIEVKRDRQAHRTGNVVVEFGYRGRKSGLAVTTANWWAFVLDDAGGGPASIVLVPLPRLRELAAHAYRTRGPMGGGDDGESDIVLIPVAALTEGRTRCSDGRSAGTG